MAHPSQWVLLVLFRSRTVPYKKYPTIAPVIIACLLLLQSLAAAPAPAPRPLLFLGDKDYPPVAYLDNGVPRGMDVDLVKALAGPLHHEVRIELMDWNVAQQKVLNGEADGLIGMSVSPERQKVFAFTGPTFTREFSLVIPEHEMTLHSLADLPGKRVGVTAGGFPRKFLELRPGIRLVLVNNYQDGLTRLTNGTIDALAADVWVVAYDIQKFGVHGVTLAGKPFAVAEEAIAVRKNNAVLLAELTRATAALKADGTIARIQNDWRPQEMVFASRRQVRHLLYLTGAIAGAVIVGSLALWIVTLKRQIRIRKKVEGALLESEERWRNLTQAAFEGISISENGEIRDVNHQFLKMFGYEHRDEVVGKRVVDLVAPESRAIVAESVRLGREEIYEHRLLRKDGSSFIGEARAKMTRVGDRVLRMTALRDITENKDAEALNNMQIQVLEMITTGRPMAKTLDTLLHMIEAQAPEMLCSILLLDADGIHIRHGAAPSLPPEYMKSIDGLAIGACAGSCGTAAFRRETVIVPDIATDPLWKDYKQLALPHGLRACWSAPIFDAQRQVLGAFGIYYRNTGLPDARHIRLVDVATHCAAVCIAKHRTDAALRESEEKFSKAFRTSPDVMSITDFETGRYLDVNDAHQKTFGLTREEAIGHSPTELGIFTDPAMREQMLRSLKQDGHFSDLEIQARTRDGRVLTLLHSAELIELGGRLCVLRVSHDITDRKRALEALRESEQRFRNYFELASVGFSITSCEKRLLAVNSEYGRILGYPEAELLNKTWADLTHPDDLGNNENLFDQALAGKIDAYTLNKRLVRKDGRVIHATVSVRCVRKPDGSPDYFVSLLLDITEREEAVARERQARLEYTLQLIASQEAERGRIAGELHDSLGQSLSLIKNRAQLALLQKDLSEPAREQLEAISATTAQAIAEVRQISRDLHPYQLDHLGLTRALDALVDSADQASSIHFRKKFDAVDDAFSRDGATSLYRIVQEGTTNILKYSRAQNASVVLERDVHEVALTIDDDGCGFQPDAIDRGMGLKNIAERTRMLSGALTVDSAPGKGTHIKITIPISAEAE